MISERIKSRKGLAWPTVVLLIAVIAMSGLFLVDAYRAHLRDARLTFDRDQVSVALRNARIQYLSDGCPSGVTYYYDAEGVALRPFRELGQIKGYGRSYQDENLHAETGAPGIPNRGGGSGAQLLAISFEDEEHITIRWQGNFLTPYDMELMSTAEQARLTTEMLDQIEISRQRQQEEEQ